MINATQLLFAPSLLPPVCPKKLSAWWRHMVPAVLAVIARGVRMADQEAVAQPAAQPAAPPEEEQAQHVEDFLAQELEEADVQSLAQRSQRSHYDDPLVEAAFDHNQRAQREIVESVSTLLSQQPAMSAELLMLRQEDIQKFSVTMTQAPAGFRRRYDTGADFSWALAGFNFVVGSFYRGGIRTHESQSEICACASSQIFASKAL